MTPDVTRAVVPVTPTKGRPPFEDAPRPKDVPAATGTPAPGPEPSATRAPAQAGAAATGREPALPPDLANEVKAAWHVAAIRAILRREPAASAIKQVKS